MQRSELRRGGKRGRLRSSQFSELARGHLPPAPAPSSCCCPPCCCSPTFPASHHRQPASAHSHNHWQVTKETVPLRRHPQVHPNGLPECAPGFVDSSSRRRAVRPCCQWPCNLAQSH